MFLLSAATKRASARDLSWSNAHLRCRQSEAQNRGYNLASHTDWIVVKWPARSSIAGLRCRLSAAQQKPSSIRLSPWPPRFPGPLRHPPRASPSLVPVWRHFATFFLACWGVPAPKGHSKGFPRSGRILGGMGPDRCGSGAPNRPFEWPHSRFGRARYFFSDPPFGLFETP